MPAVQPHDHDTTDPEASEQLDPIGFKQFGIGDLALAIVEETVRKDA